MANKITTTFDGDTRKLERAISQLQARQERYEKRTADSHRRAAAQASRSWEQANQRIASQQASIGQTLTRFSGVLAGAFGAQEAVRLADTFTQFEAKLINAKVASEDMAGVQAKLMAAANANGTEVVALADLYGNMAMSAKSVGLSQSEMMLATEGVAAAMRLSGSTTAQSSATIMQLGQALAGGTVRAEEYNSQLENAPALVRAVAESSDRWKGDLGKLRQEINDGKVSSEAWAQAIVAASNKLKADAANAPLTVAASMQILENKLVEFIGKADDTLGASDKLAWALDAIGNHIDDVATVAIVLAAALVARLVPGLLATGNAALGSSAKLLGFQIAMQRSMTGSSTAMAGATVMAGNLSRGLGSLSAMMGGPLGIALTLLVGGIVLAKNRMEELKRRATELPASFTTTTTAIDEFKNAQIEAANKTGEAAKQAWEQVRALEAVAKASLLASKAEAQRKIDMANSARAEADRLIGVANRSRANRQPGHAGTIADGDQARAQGAITRANQLAAEGRQAAIAYDRAQAQLNTPVSTNTGLGSGGGGGGGSGTGSGSGSGRGATSAEDRDRNSAQAIQQAEDALRSATLALATTTEERLRLQTEGIKIDAERQREALAQRVKDGEITQAAADEVKLAIDRTENAQLLNANREAQAETEAKIAALADIRLRDDQELANLHEAYLSDMASMARTVSDRENWERQALATRQTAESEAFDAQQAVTRLEWQKAGMLEDEINRRLQANKAAFDAQQTSQTQAQEQGFKDSSPLGQYRQEISDVNTAFKTVQADGLKGFEDSLVEAVSGAKDLKTAFADLAKSIVADLARIAIQQAIMKPIANWMSGGSGGGSGGGIFSSITSLFSKIPGKAAGTNSLPRSGMTLVGEQGPELLNLPRGSGIMPNHLLRSALAARPTASRGSGQVINLSTNVYANDAVLASTLRQEIATAQMQSISTAMAMTRDQQQKRAGRVFMAK